MKILVIDSNAKRDGAADQVVARLLARPEQGCCELLTQPPTATEVDSDVAALVYFPKIRKSAPDPVEAEQLISLAADSGAHLVAISSAEVYGARPQNPGFIDEGRPASQNGRDWYGGMNAQAQKWIAFESMFERLSGDEPTRVVLLRPAPVLARGSGRYLSRLLDGAIAVTLPGHDPSLQLLTPQDLAQAVCLAVEQRASGVYNVSSDGVLPLRRALRMAGARRLPVPRAIQRIVRAVGLGHPGDQLEYVRYSWTISNEKIKSELSFRPKTTSVEALERFVGETGRTRHAKRGEFDDFGMDRSYVAAYGRTLFAFLERIYWRIEVNGLDNIPRKGRAILAGVHRGFMPWDGI